MIKIFEGDEFLCELEINKLIEKYKETELNIHHNSDIKNPNLFFTVPILAKYNVFLLSYANFEKLHKTNEKFFDLLPKSTVVLVYVETIDKRKKIYNYIKKSKIKVSVLPELDERKMVNWISKIARQNEIDINPKAVSLLVHYLNNSLRAVYNELFRLSDLTEGKQITSQIVKLNTSVEREFKLWELSNMLVNRKIRDSYLILKFLGNSSDVFSIVRYLQNFYFNLIQVRISKKLLDKYQKYTIDKYYESSKKYKYSDLLNILTHCITAETDIKFGGASQDIIVKSLVNYILTK